MTEKYTKQNVVRHNNMCLTFVNNQHDTSPKTLTAEVLELLLESPVTGVALDRYIKYGLEDGKKSLPAVMFSKSPQFVGLEISAKTAADTIFAHAKEKIKSKTGIEPEQSIAMAYRTPGMGLTLVVRRRCPEQSLEQELNQWQEILEMPFSPACMNPDHLYLLTTRSEILHYNPQLLFSQYEKPTPEDFSTPPPLPKNLPESIRTMIEPVPDNAKPAVAIGVFSALRVMLSEVQFRYVDNTVQEPPCCMNLFISNFASGKSAIRRPLQEILWQVQNEDMQSREKYDKWRQECSILGANQNRPAEPNAPIRIVQPDMTNPALVKLAKRASPYSLYTYGEELEKLYRLKGASEVIRCAFDTEMYGQERVGCGSVSEVVRLRWSFNFSTTPFTARKMLKNEISNGTLSRLCLSTIIQDNDDWGEEIPMYGEFGEKYRTAVAEYTRQLSAVKGIIDCPEARDWTLRQKQRWLDRLKICDARFMLGFLWRSLYMGFSRAVMLWIIHGMQWSDEIEQFASWSVDFDMGCKMHFFGDLIEKEAENDTVNTHRSNMLLTELPEHFTREDAREMRRSMGKSISPTAVKNMLATWVHRGFIRFNKEEQMYHKTNEYTSVISQPSYYSRAPVH